MYPCTLVYYLCTLSKLLQKIQCACISRDVCSASFHVERILNTADRLV